MDIGPAKRIHEIRPVSVPIPEPAVPDLPAAPTPQPADPVTAPAHSDG